MTSHRTRKRLIRERMSRTGETYSTARRHVLAKVAGAGSAPPPPGLVSGYARFGGGQHHESTLLAHVLQQYGVVAPHTGQPYSEPMLCGLGGGIGFMYAVFEYRGLPPMLTIVAQHHPEPWAPAVLDRLAAGYRIEHSTATGAALTALRRTLDAGTAVYCTVARNGLPWHRSHSIAADPYPVVVAGADGDRLYLDDEAVTPRPLPVEAFGAAWAAHRKGRHERLWLTGAPTAALPEAIRHAVASTVAHLTGPVLGNAFDANFGFSGMTRLADQLRDRRGKSGWLRRFATPVALGVGLGRLAECLESQYTAPGATRPLYADFLDEAARIVEDPRLPEAATLFRTSGALWSRLADRAVQALPAEYAAAAERRLAAMFAGDAATSGGPDEPVVADLGLAAPTLFDELAELVEQACDVERRAVGLLGAWSGPA